MNINIIVKNKLPRSRKRKGFAIVFTMVIVLVAFSLVASMFNTVSSFTNYFTEYRRAYTDIITASSFLEYAKGRVVAMNFDKAETLIGLLHGVENTREPGALPFAPGIINSLRGLLISSGDSGGVFEFSRDISVNGPQVVEVQVFDANYSIESLSDTFPAEDYLGLPPSFFIQGITHGIDWTRTSLDGEDYNELPPEHLYDSDSIFFAYTKYGAYLVRVTLYDRIGTNKLKKVKIIEEAFIQIAPFYNSSE